MTTATQTQFKVGQFVRVNVAGWSRRDKIAEVTKNSNGITIYVLRDGGRFDATEIETA